MEALCSIPVAFVLDTRDEVEHHLLARNAAAISRQALLLWSVVEGRILCTSSIRSWCRLKELGYDEAGYSGNFCLLKSPCHLPRAFLLEQSGRWP